MGGPARSARHFGRRSNTGCFRSRWGWRPRDQRLPAAERPPALAAVPSLPVAAASTPTGHATSAAAAAAMPGPLRFRRRYFRPLQRARGSADGGRALATAAARHAPVQAAACVDPLAETPGGGVVCASAVGRMVGPAPAQVMRNGSASERVGPDYLVWRGGVARLAARGGRVSPTRRRPDAGMQQVAGGVAVDSVAPFNDDWVDAIIDTHLDLAAPRRHARPQSNLSLVITLVIILLAAVLAIVLIHSDHSEPGIGASNT